MDKNSDVQDLEQKIREIDQEMAAADLRLERFRQAVDACKQRNRAVLEMIGASSFEELEEAIRKNKIHPSGMELMAQALKEKGKTVPDYLEEVILRPGHTDTDAAGEAAAGQEKPKKQKRMTFKL